jgi:hypothetical protein
LDFKEFVMEQAASHDATAEPSAVCIANIGLLLAWR